MNLASQVLKKQTDREKRLGEAINRIVGYKPSNLALYQLAMRHTSVAKEVLDGVRESNERLEYLGDAMLGAVIAEFLFKKFPYKDEGFLTEIRARIVNRESLNSLAKKVGIAELVQFDNRRKGAHTHKSIYGDSLEAMVGAVYLDKGFKKCRRFIVKKLLLPHHDLEHIIKYNPNHKSRIIEWAQKENREIRFEIVEVKGNRHSREFVAQVFVDEKPLARGTGYTKKKAEQDAAEKSCDSLSLN